MRRRSQACAWTTVTILATAAAPALAQDPCPSASAEDAESGWVAYQAGDMIEARTRFQAALARCDNDQYARTGQGYVALRDGRTDEAIGLFGVVLRSEPNNVDALVGAGLGSWRTADLDAVRRHFERVAMIEPDHPTALEYLALVDGAGRSGGGAPDEAEEAWMNGDTDRALALYEARLQSDDSDGMALLRVGLMRAWSEDYDGALELLDRLVELEPTNVDGRLARARVHAWQGDLTRARSEVDEVLALTPDNADAIALWALLQSWGGDIEGALDTYERLLTLAPEHAEGRRQQGRALGWAGELDQAIASYRILVEQRPDDLSARAGLASVLAMAGQYGEALSSWDRVLAEAPDDVEARNGRTRALAWSGRLVAAEEAALETLEIDPESGAAWAELSEVYSIQGRPADALNAQREAALHAPTDAAIEDRLRWLERGFDPVAWPTFTAESDSDGNTMLTTGVRLRWYADRRLAIDFRGYVRDMGQDFVGGTLARNSYRVGATATYQLGPGWAVATSLGVNTTDADDATALLAFDAMVRTPDRYPVRVSLALSTAGLDETAILASRQIRSTNVRLTANWYPDSKTRVAGAVSTGRYDGIDTNGRRAASLAASRDVAPGIALGVSFRGLSFEKNLFEGYFDPDFYGVGEVTGTWTHRPRPWAFTVEAAPGIQQARRGTGVSGSVRALVRTGYQIGDGRELFLTGAYSSAGLTSFSNGVDGYRYTAIVAGVNWIL